MSGRKYTKEDIFRIVEEEDVEFIRLQFCDIFGKAKNVAVTVSQLDKALNNECIVDICGLEGFADGEESDMFLYPEYDTFDIYPWRPQTGKVARMFCSLYTMNHQPFQSDPRFVLKKIVKKAADMGLTFEISPRQEFFLFSLDDNAQPTTLTHEYAGYMDVAPADTGENVRRDIILNLEQMDFDVTASHHEGAPGQHEIDFHWENMDRAADMILTFRMAVKTIARKHGLYATFLPKPTEGVSGSGMHINFLCRDRLGKNMFYDKDDKRGLSETAYHFIAGILEHIQGITLVTNPLVNSYKRLVPGYGAPVDIAWSSKSSNRSALIRIPSRRGDSTRIELRNPDSTCNPYLAFALCVAAGLDGIERGLEPPEEVIDNLFKKTRKELESIKVGMLPQTLGEAITQYEKDDFVRGILGDQIFELFLDAKRKEWYDFRKCVSRWEINEYLNKY